MRVFLTIIFVAAQIFIAFAQQQISGYVRANNKAVPNVVVSVGISTTITDKNGYYTLQSTEGDKFVQISTPSGYVPNVLKTIPSFYQKIEPLKSNYDFELIKSTKSDKAYKFFVQTDVQVANRDDLTLYEDYMLTDIQQTLEKDKKSIWFGVDLGDMVGDDPNLFEPYVEAMSKLDVPVYRTIGNHDMAYWGRSFETSETHFNKHFGPTRYSFDVGNVHYIVLNNNFYIGRDYFYMGYIDEQTFLWLERDLKYVPKDKTVFVMLHIPTRLQVEKPAFQYNYSLMGGTTINADPLYNLLKEHKTHILSGHTHLSNNIVHSDSLYEHNIAAASGSWWSLDVCTDGTPRGYRVFEINESEVSWYYKSQGYPKEYQFRAQIDNEGNIVANVWNYDSAWKVEWLEDDNVIGEMARYEGVDPYVQALCTDRSKIKYDWIAPSKTNHLFKAKLKKENASVKIRVTDRFGNIYTSTIK